MVGMLLVVLGAGGFVPADGGFLSAPKTAVPHRVLEVSAPTHAGETLWVSDGDAPSTKLGIRFVGSAAGEVLDGGDLRYPGFVRLGRPDPLTVRFENDGELGVTLPPITHQDGPRAFIQTARARFEVRASGPVSIDSAGVSRVAGANAWLSLELLPIADLRPWPARAEKNWGSSMAFHEAAGMLVRHGGTDDQTYEQGTFVWDDTLGWVYLPIPSPPPRLRSAMTYDRDRQRIVLFGGMSEGGGTLDDTWEFDGTQWQQIQPATRPPPRWSHGLVFDQLAGHSVLFGGILEDATGEYGDTWTWNGTTWTQLFPLISPSPRDAFGMAWDGTNQRVTLAGGWNGFVQIDESWAWTGANWTQLAPIAGIDRTSTSMAWNAITGKLVLAGGQDPRGGPRYDDAVDLFEGPNWVQGPPLPQPLMRAAMATHPTWGLVLFGGRNREVSGATLGLDSAWHELPASQRADGQLPLDPARLVGERWEWIAQDAGWRTTRRTGLTPRRVLGSPIAGPLIVGDLPDGGGWALRWADQRRVPPPPVGSRLGGRDAVAWAVTPANELLRFDGYDWRAMGTVPAGLVLLEQRAGTGAYFAWRQGLVSWDPGRGIELPLDVPFVLDAGLQVVSRADVTFVITSEGTWQLTPDGGWEAFAHPRSPDRFEVHTIVFDGGVAAYAPLKPVGARCEQGSECQNSVCRDGRCCDRECAAGCETCSRERGAREDGVCGAAAAGTVCYEEGCVVGRCDGTSTSCYDFSELLCAADAGTARPDGGRPAADAGDEAPEPEPEPGVRPGCGCSSGPHALVLLLAAWVLERRRSRER